MNKHLLLIHVLGKWWKMEIDCLEGGNIVNGGPLGVGPKLSSQLTYTADVIYDLTTKEMIKNKTGESVDFAILKLWLKEPIPTLEYEHKSFNRAYKIYTIEQAGFDIHQN